MTGHNYLFLGRDEQIKYQWVEGALHFSGSSDHHVSSVSIPECRIEELATGLLRQLEERKVQKLERRTPIDQPTKATSH